MITAILVIATLISIYVTWATLKASYIDFVDIVISGILGSALSFATICFLLIALVLVQGIVYHPPVVEAAPVPTPTPWIIVVTTTPQPCQESKQ